ncbi:outer membrane beta-barrel protein [Mucilaginibacter sp. AW1-3]
MAKPYLLRTHLLLIFIAFTAMSAFAQLKHGTIKARLIDATTKQPVELANVSIAIVKDSTIIRNALTDKTGIVEFTGLALGSYRLNVYQMGLKPIKLPFTLNTATPYAQLGDIMMEPSVHNLKEVSINEEKAPVTIKKDTVEFNASSYKTQKNDNVEELLKKLPGVDVDKDGKITSQGKEVNKVLVDGKEFFGNDPKAVTKNLPADAIAKVQVIDDKTESAKKTGIDDGTREKVINVTLKEDKKHGWFGNMSLAGGSEDRYLAQFNMNDFDKKKQIAFLSLSNNINEVGFSYEDLNNFAGGNVFNTFGSSDGSVSININSNGRADINGAFSGVSGGLITSHTAGVNYTDEFGKTGQLKFNTNFLTVISRNTVNRSSDLQDIPNSLFTTQLNDGNNTSSSYRLSMNFDYKIDSLNSIGFKPNASMTYKKNYSASTSGTLNQLADSVNSIRQMLDQSSHSPAVGGQFSVNHRFHNGRGSLNFFTNGNYSANNADYNNQALTRFYIGGAANSNVNQQASQDNDASFITGTASFVRQLNRAKKINLNISQSFDVRKQDANQYTVDYNAVTGLYEVLNPLYSGNSDNRNHRYATSAGISKSSDELNFGITATLAELGLHGTSFSNNLLNDVSRDTWALVPSAYFNYRKKNGPSIYFNVSSNVQLPSATDLQTVFNNTNPLYIRQGNADLQQSRSLNGSFNYNIFDTKNNSYTNFYANFNTIWNGFATTSTINNGITTSKPINVDGNYNVNVGFNFSKPTKVKGLRYSLGSYGSVNRNINFIGGNRNEVVRLTPNANIGSNFDRDKFQFGLRLGGGYSNASNSYQHLADQHYFTVNNNLTASVLPVKSWRIFTNINQNLYRGQQAGANISYYLWNAGAEHYFFKDQTLTLSFNAFDLLNQNSGIQRSISTSGVIQNMQTNTLGQYFYLKLTYKINKVGGKTNAQGSPIIIMR